MSFMAPKGSASRSCVRRGSRSTATERFSSPRALDKRGVDVAHIHADGRLEPHDEAMNRLLDILRLPRDDLYRTREELIAAAIARQSERVAYAGDKPAARIDEQVS